MMAPPTCVESVCVLLGDKPGDKQMDDNHCSVPILKVT